MTDNTTITTMTSEVSTSDYLSDPVFDLTSLSIEAVPALTEPGSYSEHNPGPHHKYDRLVVHGFTRQLTQNEIPQHPLIALLHDFKHLMLHGDRGSSSSRHSKRKRREPYENSYCRIGFVYLFTQDRETHDLNISFLVDTAFQPVWTKFDGSVRSAMTPEEIVNTVDNFIESYLVEAEALVAGDPYCEIEATMEIQEVAGVSEMAGV